MKKQKLLFIGLLITSVSTYLCAEENGDLNKQIKDLKSDVFPEVNKEKRARKKAFPSQVAWFNLDLIFSESLEYKDELERIENSIREREEDMVKLKKEHDDAMSKLQNAGNTMKEDARERTMERVTEIRQRMEMKRNSLEQYLQRERVAVQSKLMEKIYEAANKVMEAEGWDAATPMIPKELVRNKNMDISQEIITELNKNHKPLKKASVQQGAKATQAE